MEKLFFEPYITRITHLSLNDGGFASDIHGRYRPDITAWAVLALNALSPHSTAPLLENARDRLAQDQQHDGSLSMSGDQPDAVWPTSLAIFAWSGVPKYHKNRNKAVQFLVEHTGLHMKKKMGMRLSVTTHPFRDGLGLPIRTPGYNQRH